MRRTKIARDEILFPARAFCSNGSEKSRKLCIAHLLTIDGKFRDADFVHRLLILGVVSGFPLKLPGADSDHIGKLSVGRRSEVQRLQKNNQSCRAAPQRRTRAIILMVKIFPSILRNELRLRKPRWAKIDPPIEARGPIRFLEMHAPLQTYFGQRSLSQSNPNFSQPTSALSSFQVH